ncbi:MAG: DinB/UmuC family translesion DNA polymerase [Chthoniobacterales bacterium]
MKSKADRAVEIKKIIAILHQWGIHSLGQFAALEKEDVALRLGPEAVRMWERASGTATRLLKLVEPPESFVESFEFENEIETSEPLLLMLRRFLEQFSRRLGAHYLVAQELKLRIAFSDKNSYERVFKIPQPSNSIETLFRMLQTHLENFTSPSPIVGVSLEAEPTKPSRQQFSLFETALRDPAQLSETLARLVGLLGVERVGTPVLEDTYRPDAFRMEPFSWELPNESLTPRMPAVALRRFRSSTRASILLHEEKPRHVRGSEMQGEILQHDGPYLASGNWWDEKSWERAEWDFELDGILCRCHEANGAWQIDGIYD